jgi:two-component system CheB/CheR fusion protein
LTVDKKNKMVQNNNPENTSSVNFPVVGIGASAGGLDAFKKLLKNVSLNSGMAYVLVQHLAPAHESLLPEILARETQIPVHEITDDISISANNIYIIPENKILTAYDGKLKLEPRELGKSIPMPIDVFFNSLADVHRGFSRGVVLSGTGYDGTIGLKTIKECGGSTFVQNPDSAGFDGMPLSAIRAGAADFVLEAEEIPAYLLNLDLAYESSHAYIEDDLNLQKSDDDNFKQIIRVLKQRTGHDFSHYKQPTIRRRIARRMVITKMHSPESYYNLLRNNVSEQDALFNDVLIPVSYFFRDSKIFATLPETVLPHIMKNKGPEDSIRMWVAGCSTGEEAYSIAICLHEYLGEKLPDMKVQIFASDLSENVINKARTGIYSRQEVQNVSDKRLKKYFTKIESLYHVNKEVRDMCVFAVHNFVKDPPFAKMDLISCRNVLIYLDPFLQKKALNTFHYSLRDNGVLFLGKSETASTAASLFEPLIKNHKIFLRRNTNDNFISTRVERSEKIESGKLQALQKKASLEPDFYKLAKEVLFSDFTPAAVIVDENKEILHFHANTEPFLVQQPGKPNFNLYKMAREGIVFELRNAIVKCKNTRQRVKKENVPLKGKDYQVSFEVVPLGDSEFDNYYLILFQQANPVVAQKMSVRQRNSEESVRIKQLEAEIEQMRDDIRKVTEEQEVANEELQSANEELLSNSEELQTLNEELETSAEELQSNNEELISVNDELTDRQAQLTMSRLYSEAIIETIREPLVVLNSQMRVRSANAAFYKYFKTSEQDIEEKVLFDSIQGTWNAEEFKEKVLRVLPERLKLEDLEISVNVPDMGTRTILVNIRPIINDTLNEQLILIALEDITDIRAANMSLVQNYRELEENNKELTSFSYVASHDLQEPLRKIYTFSKLIVDDGKTILSEDSGMYLDRILVSTARMQQLIDDLLHYSHVGKATYNELEATDITQLIQEVVLEIKESAGAKHAVITISELPHLQIIPTLVFQLFLNIIGNAIKYSRPDVPPQITVTYTIASSSEVAQLGGDGQCNYCKIRVEDNGIGFSQADALRIFEPFKRLHSKDKYEGTGIGLAICKKIMVQHKGFITASSTLNTGTIFNLYFPL